MRLLRDGKVFRQRRGKWVEIPPEWVGQTVHAQTKDKRASKGVRKDRLRRETGGPNKKHPSTWAPRHSRKNTL